MLIPEGIDFGGDALAALETAALACGRLGATVDSSPAAASDVLLLRHTNRAFDVPPAALAGNRGEPADALR